MLFSSPETLLSSERWLIHICRPPAFLPASMTPRSTISESALLVLDIPSTFYWPFNFASAFDSIVLQLSTCKSLGTELNTSKQSQRSSSICSNYGSILGSEVLRVRPKKYDYKDNELYLHDHTCTKSVGKLFQGNTKVN